VSRAFADLPEKLTLTASKLRWALVGGAGLLFVAMGVFLMLRGDVIVGALSAAFFGLVALVAIPGLTGWRSRLELDGQGFTCLTPLRTWRREWSDCSAFTPIQIQFNRFVGFSSTSDDQQKPMLTGANKMIGGTGGMLPDTYGMKPADLARLMNRFRARALKLPEPLL
jgi:hypothetical protein